MSLDVRDSSEGYSGLVNKRPCIVLIGARSRSKEKPAGLNRRALVIASTASRAAIRCRLRFLADRRRPMKRDWLNYAGIGSAHQISQDYDKAAALYLRALEERPNARWIYRNLASTLSGAGRVEATIQTISPDPAAP